MTIFLQAIGYYFLICNPYLEMYAFFMLSQSIYGMIAFHCGTDTTENSYWLDGVSACIGVCHTEAGLDLFSSSRKNNDVLTWFAKLTQLVISQDR